MNTFQGRARQCTGKKQMSQSARGKIQALFNPCLALSTVSWLWEARAQAESISLQVSNGQSSRPARKYSPGPCKAWLPRRKGLICKQKATAHLFTRSSWQVWKQSHQPLFIGNEPTKQESQSCDSVRIKELKVHIYPPAIVQDTRMVNISWLWKVWHCASPFCRTCPSPLLGEGSQLPRAGWHSGKVPAQHQGLPDKRESEARRWAITHFVGHLDIKREQTRSSEVHKKARAMIRCQRLKCWLLPNPEQNSHWFHWTQPFTLNYFKAEENYQMPVLNLKPHQKEYLNPSWPKVTSCQLSSFIFTFHIRRVFPPAALGAHSVGTNPARWHQVVFHWAKYAAFHKQIRKQTTQTLRSEKGGKGLIPHRVSSSQPTPTVRTMASPWWGNQGKCGF